MAKIKNNNNLKSENKFENKKNNPRVQPKQQTYDLKSYTIQ